MAKASGSWMVLVSSIVMVGAPVDGGKRLSNRATDDAGAAAGAAGAPRHRLARDGGAAVPATAQPVAGRADGPGPREGAVGAGQGHADRDALRERLVDQRARRLVHQDDGMAAVRVGVEGERPRLGPLVS